MSRAHVRGKRHRTASDDLGPFAQQTLKQNKSATCGYCWNYGGSSRTLVSAAARTTDRDLLALIISFIDAVVLQYPSVSGAWCFSVFRRLSAV